MHVHPHVCTSIHSRIDQCMLFQTMYSNAFTDTRTTACIYTHTHTHTYARARTHTRTHAYTYFENVLGIAANLATDSGKRNLLVGKRGLSGIDTNLSDRSSRVVKVIKPLITESKGPYSPTHMHTRLESMRHTSHTHTHAYTPLSNAPYPHIRIHTHL